MAKGKTNPALVTLLVGVLFIFVGLAALGASLILNDDKPETALLYDIIMYVGIGVAVLGIILTAAGAIGGKKSSRARQKRQTADSTTEVVGDVEIQLDGTATYNNVAPTYVPQTETYEFITVGRKQSLDDKFDQIGKMGKTQFVIYVAKLFSLKGFEVQLTPVIDNNNVDMIVKKDGVSRAVGCFVSNKVLCKEDIEPLFQGESYYHVDGSMAVTNMYFDRTSLEFAKARKMTLVDRGILAERYMN